MRATFLVRYSSGDWMAPVMTGPEGTNMWLDSLCWCPEVLLFRGPEDLEPPSRLELLVDGFIVEDPKWYSASKSWLASDRWWTPLPLL